MKHIISLILICLAAIVTLAACGPKHDAKKTVKKKQMFYTTANKAAEDGVLNINNKYKNADKETQREYREELAHIESIDTKTNYIGAMMLLGFCEGADKFSIKQDQNK